MKVSYAITVCKEEIELQKLVPFLLKHKELQDEIVITYDHKHGSKGVEEYLRTYSVNGEFNWHTAILEMNEVDLVWIPRVNTVDGITDEHIQKWGWKVSEQGWVNFPDYQPRVFRNIESICWEGKVHEHIIGCETYAHLPPHEELSIYHPKTIHKQIQQNEYYNAIITDTYL